jgi:transposase
MGEELYCGIDLHSNNGYYGIVDKEGTRVMGRKLPNDLGVALSALCPYKERIKSVAVESTFNWYWLVDGLMENGYPVKLANPAAMVQYEGLKDANDKTDCFFLCEQQRLGVLPTGHIYPKAERPVRDLLRRRTLFVHQRTTQTLSLQSMIHRLSGAKMDMRSLLRLEPEEFAELLKDEDSMFTATQNIQAISFLSLRVKAIEERVLGRIKLKPEYERLLSIPGVGIILAMTIMMETGDIHRFPDVGNYTSYCRGARAIHLSNGKKKADNNQKNGNKYLSWAFVEAAHHCVRACPKAYAFCERKKAKRNGAVAVKALAAKLAKAAYYIMRDQVMFDEKRIFG